METWKWGALEIPSQSLRSCVGSGQGSRVGLGARVGHTVVLLSQIYIPGREHHSG